MKQTKFNAADELRKLTEEVKAKETQIFLKEDILNKGDFDHENLIIYSTGSIGFGWRTPLNKEEVKKVFSVFPISGKNKEIKFASSEKNFITDSPLFVTWENSHSYHHAKNFKLCYESNGVDIQITVPASHFASHTWFRPFQGKHRGFGRYEMFQDIFINYFYTQSYSGGYNTLYFLEGAETLKEYENFVITGEFKYSNEI